MTDFDGCVYFGEYSASFKAEKEWYLFFKMVNSLGDTIKGKTAYDWCDALSPYVSTEGGIPDPMDTVDMFISQHKESFKNFEFHDFEVVHEELCGVFRGRGYWKDLFINISDNFCTPINKDFESHYSLIDWDRFDPKIDCSVRDFEEK